MGRLLGIGLALLIVFPQPALAQVVTSAQEQAELLATKALLDAQAGKTEAALDLVRQAVVSDPHHVYAWMLLGQLALEDRQYAEAAEAFRRVRELAPDQLGLNLLLGRALFHAGKPAEALIELDAALASHPEDATAHLYRGLALLRLGRSDEATEAVKRATQLDPTLGGAAELVAGMAHLQKADWAAAERALEAAIREEAGSPLGDLADRLRQEVAQRRREERPLRFHLKMGTEWDTNVQQVESDIVRNNDSLVSTGEAGLDFRHQFGRRGVVALGGLVQEIYPYEQKDLDIQGALGYLYTGVKVGPITLLPQYVYSFYRLDNESFLQIHSVQPTVVWSTFLGAMRGYYEFQTRKFFTQPERDGELHAVGLAQRVSLGKLTRWVEVGYRFEREQADTPDFLRAQHILGGRLAWDLPWSLSLRFRGSYTFRDYVETHSDFGVERDEEVQRYEVKVQRPLSEHVSLAVGYAYMKNAANVAIFDTDRNRYIIELAYEF